MFVCESEEARRPTTARRAGRRAGRWGVGGEGRGGGERKTLRDRFCLVEAGLNINTAVAARRGMRAFVGTFVVMSSVLSLAPPGQEGEEWGDGGVGGGAAFLAVVTWSD